MDTKQFNEFRNRIFALHAKALDESRNKEVPWKIREVWSNQVSAYSHVLNLMNEFETLGDSKK